MPLDLTGIVWAKSTFAAPGSPTTGLQIYDLEGAEPSGDHPHQKPPLKFAAGIILADKDGEVLFLKRDDGTWGIPGGMVEAGETALQAAKRELLEECQYELPEDDRREVITTAGDVVYTTFYQRIDEQFEPVLNHEHIQFKWMQPDNPPQPLHPGLRAALPVLVSEVTTYTMKAQGAMENLTLFLPLMKADATTRTVYGTAVVEEVDHVGEIFDYASSKPHFQEWSEHVNKASGGKSLGNVRSMHGKVAAGKLTDMTFNDNRKAIEVAAKVVDNDEWKKVEEGVYTGFSIGGRYIERWQDGDYKRYTAAPSEVSLVDLPCVKGATFTMIKANGAEEVRKFNEAAMTKAKTVISNDDVVSLAITMAEKVGDKRDYPNYLVDARKQLEKAADDAGKLKKEDDKPENEKTSHTVNMEKAAAEDPPAEAKKDPIEAKATGDGGWSQVWVHERLPGKQYAKKAEMLKALLELDAEEAIQKKAAPLLAALEEKPKEEEVKKAEDPPLWKQPLADKAALESAVQSYVKSGDNNPMLRRHIIRDAQVLKATDVLPEDWGTTKKFTDAALADVEGKDALQKAVSLYFVADLLGALATVESLESQCEMEGGYPPWMSSAEVPKALQDRFGKMLIEFGDIISDILGEILGSMAEGERTKALERAAPVVDLIKVGARHSAETMATIRQVVAHLVNAFGEDVFKPAGKAGEDPDASKPGVSGAEEGKTTVRPRRRVGQNHPSGGVPSGIGDTSPYKDLSAEDLTKALVDHDTTIADLTQQVTDLEAQAQATDAAQERLIEKLSAKMAERDAGLQKTIEDLRAENEKLSKKVDRAQTDLTAVRNTPAGLPYGVLRVAEKAADRARPQPSTIASDISEDELRLAGERTYLNRNYGSPMTRRAEDSQ